MGFLCYLIAWKHPSAENLKVLLKDNVLTMSGRSDTEEEKTEGSNHIRERSLMSFERQYELPSTCDSDSLKAKFENGVLTITIEKKEPSVPSGKSIKID